MGPRSTSNKPYRIRAERVAANPFLIGVVNQASVLRRMTRALLLGVTHGIPEGEGLLLFLANPNHAVGIVVVGAFAASPSSLCSVVRSPASSRNDSTVC